MAAYLSSRKAASSQSVSTARSQDALSARRWASSTARQILRSGTALTSRNGMADFMYACICGVRSGSAASAMRARRSALSPATAAACDNVMRPSARGGIAGTLVQSPPAYP